MIESYLTDIYSLLGITNFDLLGDFGAIEWLGNFQIVLLYNLVFGTTTALCLVNKFTAPVRRELRARLVENYVIFTNYMSFINWYLSRRRDKTERDSYCINHAMMQRFVESRLISLTSFYAKYYNLSRKRTNRNTTASRQANQVDCWNGIMRGTKWEYENANGNTLYKELIQILILILILILIHNKIDISMLRCLLLCLIVVVKLCPVVLRLFRRNNLSSYCKSFFKSWKIVFTFAVSWISHGWPNRTRVKSIYIPYIQ